MTATEWQAVLAGFAAVAVAAATITEKIRGSAKDHLERESSRERLTQEGQEKATAQLQVQLVALYTENQLLRDRWTQMFSEWRIDCTKRELREDELLQRALQAENALAIANLKLQETIACFQSPPPK
jgi:fructosamine-3-kinase